MKKIRSKKISFTKKQISSDNKEENLQAVSINKFDLEKSINNQPDAFKKGGRYIGNASFNVNDVFEAHSLKDEILQSNPVRIL